ncbi:MAG: lytic transglycosylase domain-containing protein [Rhodospirillales bacterium]|nr:lytic transglycosylase domain-containing protein [Rhodospirillales bacterium]MBT4627059.1 lytic transglycosylase domain-containing protein [Rhodospirillales bacterium]MBT5350784.1 lytic transglycosylase domain-containing protein [Rhodospirillales bacterium]MBT5521375.1 lytic transglycosylase domain-containing protein [Rhodospirillales bacterium]MBT6110425.1 lytic transglycosylase domain-containing protein [Rhodospirillales bacterium]
MTILNDAIRRLPVRAAVAITVVASLFAPSIHAVNAADDGVEPVIIANVTTTIDGNTMSEVSIPRILGADDVERYREIFAMQEDGQWKKADKIIGSLENDILMGHVLEQRYMHPNKYRSKYKELKDWMALYYDHPQAARVYKLALRRRPSNWKYPKKPEIPRASYNAPYKSEPLPSKKLSKAKRRKVRQLRRQIKRHAGRGLTLAVKRTIQSSQVKNLFSIEQYDEVAARLGFRYFIDGRDEWALEWAGNAAKRSGILVPEAHWAAGLAAYRLGRFSESAGHFEALAVSDRVSPWLAAAGGFWAARVNLMDRNPSGVNPMLKIAAEHPRTFYGILARRVLGWDLDTAWNTIPLDQSTLTKLATTPRGSRAIALVQVDQHRLAERELRNEAAAADDESDAHGILTFAIHANMPQLALRLDELLFPTTGGFDSAAYPVPRWAPEGGFTIDPALVYALIRQESKFNPKAKSWAGASGLMQLMPSTASFVARDRRYKSSKRKELLEPILNLSLGQRYIEILRDDKKINGNLVSLVAAWNGGPGNVNKWRRTIDFQDDPLLFIETIPSRETRGFVERVLANLWIYRDRFNQDSPSLTTLASGAWPIYTSVAVEPDQVVETESAMNNE